MAHRKKIALAACIAMLCIVCTVLVAAPKKTAGGYRIEVQIAGVATGTKVILSECADAKFAKTDSSSTDAGGKVVFAGKDALKNGMYNLAVANNDTEIVIDFFITDNAPQQFSFSFDKNAGMQSLKINGSPENACFFETLQYVMERQEQGQALQQQAQALIDSGSPNVDANSIAFFEKRMRQISGEIATKWNQAEAAFKGSMLALFIQSTREPEAPEPNLPATAAGRDSLLNAYYSNFYTCHFFDNIAFSDTRTLRLPILEEMINTYFTRVLSFEKDTLKKGCDILFEKARANRELYEYAVRSCYDFFREAPYPEIAGIAGYIAERYVVDDKGAWKDAAYVSRLEYRVKQSKLNPVGQLASDPQVQDAEGKAVPLYEVEAPYTILYFYNPGCHTCALVTPRVWNAYQKFRSKGLKVVAVYVDTNKEEWTSYISLKKYDWINTWKPEDNEKLYELYDLHAIPSIYIVDKNKHVVQRDIFIEQLDDTLTELFVE